MDNWSEAKFIKDLLHEFGEDEENEAVINGLVEHMKRYTVSLLCDAKDFSNHANNDEITAKDAHLAVRLNKKTHTSLPSKTELIQIGEQVNSIPLPTPPIPYQPRLPLDILTEPNSLDYRNDLDHNNDYFFQDTNNEDNISKTIETKKKNNKKKININIS